MKNTTLVLSLSLSLLAPLGCDDARSPDAAEALRDQDTAILCADAELLRDGMGGVAADPKLGAFVHGALLAAAEGGALEVPLSDLVAAAEAEELDLAAAIEAGVRGRGGSTEDAGRARAILGDFGIATLRPGQQTRSAAPQWLVALAADADLGACGDLDLQAEPQSTAAAAGPGDLAVDGLDQSAKKAGEEPSWEEFCGDMGLCVCYEAPFYYCCESML
ncbi:MAG: hypothetical protein H6711_05035 [Myxococcales bacterium]|nr:hypothetical protein [Myxococcales bacterium]